MRAVSSERAKVSMRDSARARKSQPVAETSLQGARHLVQCEEGHELRVHSVVFLISPQTWAGKEEVRSRVARVESVWAVAHATP